MSINHGTSPLLLAARYILLGVTALSYYLDSMEEKTMYKILTKEKPTFLKSATKETSGNR